MVLSGVLTLILYLTQQLGMMVGFGAEVILLYTYIAGRRDGIISETEDHIAHRLYHVLIVSLICIILSGLGITALYVASSDTSVTFAPAFIFKWGLLVVAGIFAILLKGSHLWNHLLEGLAGATWGALFLVHIFAPVTTFLFLLEFYVVWTAAFLVLWYLARFAFRKQPQEQKTPAGIRNEKPDKKVVPSSPLTTQRVVPAQAVSVPIPKMQPVALSVPIKQVEAPSPDRGPIKSLSPIYDPEALPGLPAIRVMPQSHEELQLQQRASQSIIKPA